MKLLPIGTCPHPRLVKYFRTIWAVAFAAEHNELMMQAVPRHHRGFESWAGSRLSRRGVRGGLFCPSCPVPTPRIAQGILIGISAEQNRLVRIRIEGHHSQRAIGRRLRRRKPTPSSAVE